MAAEFLICILSKDRLLNKRRIETARSASHLPSLHHHLQYHAVILCLLSSSLFFLPFPRRHISSLDTGQYGVVFCQEPVSEHLTCWSTVS